MSWGGVGVSSRLILWHVRVVGAAMLVGVRWYVCSPHALSNEVMQRALEFSKDLEGRPLLRHGGTLRTSSFFSGSLDMLSYVIQCLYFSKAPSKTSKTFAVGDRAITGYVRSSLGKTNRCDSPHTYTLAFDHN